MPAPRFEDHAAHLRAIFDGALRAASPWDALVRHLPAWDFTPPVHIVGAGKAALEMAHAASEKLGHDVGAFAVAVVPELLHGVDPASRPPGLYPADHPLPTGRNLRAAEAIAEVAREASRAGTLLALLSGGGSAHLTLPAEGLSLDDIRAVTDALLRSGADIEQLNTVRKHAERLKGGRLAALAAPARVHAFILSDVIGDRLDAIASGPTAPDPTTYADALGVLDRWHARAASPALTAHLEAGRRAEHPETPKPGDPIFDRVTNTIIGSNHTAVEAAAHAASRLGFHVLAKRTGVRGEAGRFGEALAETARRLHPPGAPRPAAAIFGGETTVAVGASDGRGGRCQHAALSAALGLRDAKDIAIAVLATDGIDGPTDAAGAIVTGSTGAAADHRGLDPALALRRHNSHPLLDAVGALLRTGPTGTNVNDLGIILRY